MEIRKPESLTQPVELRDIDFTMLGGERLPVTLRPEDTLEETEGEIVITHAKTGETLRVNRANLLWLSQRSRIVQERLPDAA